VGPPPGGRRAEDWRRTWLTRRALLLHATVLVVVPTCLALCIWQVRRVEEGNTLSWAYAFEWPFFAGYAVYLWWRLVHEQPALDQAPAGGGTDHTGRTATGPAPDDAPPTVGVGEEDEELAAYNRYLAELAAHDAERGRR
jgi:hypothetical protein